MTPITTQFEIDPNNRSVWAQIGESGRRFYPSDPTNETACKNAIIAAEQFMFAELEFQHPRRSFERCWSVVTRLFDVAAAVAESFPTYNREFSLHIDEHLQTVVAVFGSIVVSVCGDKFNVEMIVNFLTKERHGIADGITFETVIDLLRNSRDSYTSPGIDPDALHLSELNRYILNRYFAVQN